MKRYAFMLCGVVAIAALLWLVKDWSEVNNVGDGIRPAAESKGELQTVAANDEVARLQREVRSLRALVLSKEAGRQVAGADVDSEGVGQNTPSFTPSQTEEEMRRVQDATKRLLDTNIDRDGLDLQGSQQIEREAVSAIETAAVAVELKELRCSSSLCKATIVEFGEGVLPGEAVSTLMMHAPFATKGHVFVPTEPGPTVVYFTREGHSLPVLND